MALFVRAPRSGDLIFALGPDGPGWRWREHWYRLKPSWAPALFSERYGHAKVWRFPLGWRIVCRPLSTL